MPKGIVFVVALLVLLVGGCVMMAKRTHEVPLKTIETDVAANAAG